MQGIGGSARAEPSLAGPSRASGSTGASTSANASRVKCLEIPVQVQSVHIGCICMCHGFFEHWLHCVYVKDTFRAGCTHRLW